ncbi:uncharacterized protein C8R40DRAFT_1115908 [Lentinula edodes]|uniref:uncharacterized protein n=1 Tax=Lentinula edodes TaxID=5353 RepID=UPI001E8CD4FF|nr:uncharacterized protein C8R40DRAFT_1115908 [Lentinula edodes]KAH7872838.1 hypothetical protein C8R40DRAFT_1115908 [Lentinula edodes]
MRRDYKGLQGITKNGGGCGLVGLTQFSTLWPVLLRFARNKDPHSLEVSPHLLPSAGSLLKLTGQICWSNFFHYHLLSGIPAILTHTFNMHVFFLLSISNAKSQLLYACFFLVALLSITVVASPLKLAPRPLGV